MDKSQAAYFEIDCGSVDILLPAADFCGAASDADFQLELLADNPETHTEQCILVFRDERLPCLVLEKLLARLFPQIAEAEAGTQAAFLIRNQAGLSGSCLIQRNFEMQNYPLSEFRLPPASIRPYLRRQGIGALRFAQAKRLQYLLELRPLCPRVAS